MQELDRVQKHRTMSLNELEARLRELENLRGCGREEVEGEPANDAAGRIVTRQGEAEEVEVGPGSTCGYSAKPEKRESKAKSKTRSRRSEKARHDQNEQIDQADYSQTKRKRKLFEDDNDGDDNLHVLPIESGNKRHNSAHSQAFSVTAADKVLQEANELLTKKPYCRVCEQSFESKDELMAHRETDSHVEKEAEDRQQSFCALCNKQFTSPSQLREHRRGKWHQARERGDIWRAKQDQSRKRKEKEQKKNIKASMPARRSESKGNMVESAQRISGTSGRLRAKQKAEEKRK